MARPLIICDCDEVLLHMVVPFREWLDAEKHIHFDLTLGTFFQAIRHKHDGSLVMTERVWELLNEFFDSQMHAQYPIEGAVEAVNALSERADFVILTNLLDHRAEARAEQLARVGIAAPVHTNQGPKGGKIAQLVGEYRPAMTVFIDDLGNHHESAAMDAPATWRLHMVGEPEIAGSIAPARFAHARIDRWDEAARWIMNHIEKGEAAPEIALPGKEEKNE